MKIAMVSDSVLPTPSEGWGGLERVVWDWACFLAQRGHDVLLIATKGSQKPPGARLAITCEAGRERGWAHEGNHARLVTEILVREGPWDVIHENTQVHWILGRLRRAGLNWPVFSHTHRPDAIIDSPRTICCSYAQKHHIGLIQARVVYNGVRVGEMPFCSKKDDYFLYMAHIDPYKGVKEAMEAAAIADVELKVAGHTEWYRSFYNTLPWDEKRHYIGILGGEEKWQVLSRARALVFPSLCCEPGAITPLEALACGTPVITSVEGCLPEYVEHGRVGFNCTTVGEIAEAMHQIGEVSPNECRRCAEQEFDVERTAKQLEMIYQWR